MKSWKNRWKAELNNATPKLRRDVANQPINVAANVNGADSPAVAVYKRKPFWYGLSSAVAVLIIVAMCVTLIPANGGAETYAFVVEINPAVTISADSHGNVTGIVASNADADVVLSDIGAVNGLKGKPVEEAVEWYVDKSAKLGYLDEDNPSAVRISTVDNGNKLLSKISGGLESYFMKRGVKAFVITDVVDLNAFAERSGLNVSDSVKAVTDSIQALEPIFRNRNADGLTKEERQQIYKEYVSSDALVQGVGDYLSGIMDTIEQNERDVKELYDLNSQIMTHPDNRAIVKDFWSVKPFLKYFEYGEEFAALIEEMEEKVASYNEAYGDDINDVLDLYSVSKIYELVSAEDLRAVLQHFTADYLKLHIDLLSDIIHAVSLDTPLIGLTTLPETAAEFTSKILDVVTIERASREKQFEEVYNKVREQISSTDYYAFKQSLLDKYGSSDELWDNLK